MDLTYKEFELLNNSSPMSGGCSPRAAATRSVGYDYFGGMRTVDVHVRRLRAKLGPDHEALIGTVRNVGWLAVRPRAGAAPTPTPISTSTRSSTNRPQRRSG